MTLGWSTVIYGGKGHVLCLHQQWVAAALGSTVLDHCAASR